LIADDADRDCSNIASLSKHNIFDGSWGGKGDPKRGDMMSLLLLLVTFGKGGEGATSGAAKSHNWRRCCCKTRDGECCC
jgi:hypothetical protein